MKLCAIILNFFNWRDTVTSVKSIIDQSITRIVVLDNSGDEKEVTSLRKALGCYSSVEVMNSNTNLGFAGGMNYVLKKKLPLGFNYFLILNNDIIASENLVENLIEGAKSKSFDISSPIIYYYPQKDRLWSHGYYYNMMTGIVTHNPIAFLPRNCFYLTGCCMLIRREVFENIGLFDETFFMYGEDVEFSYRAVRKGYRIGIVQSVKLYHHVSLTAQNNSPFYEYHITRSHFLLINKFFNTPLKQVISLIIKSITLSMRVLVRTIKYKNKNALSGFIKAFYERLY